MDASPLQEAIDSNRPFLIRAAAGDTYEVPHRDPIPFSPKKTTAFVSTSNEDGSDGIAHIPLLAITSVETSAVVPTS